MSTSLQNPKMMIKENFYKKYDKTITVIYKLCIKNRV